MKNRLPRLRNILLITLLSITPLFAAAQDSQSPSPFSIKGYGLLNDHASAAQRAMGSVGYAMRNNRQINVMNPASYSAIDTMTFLFDIGANVGGYRSRQGSAHSSTPLGGLDYITMQVPIGRRMGASIGLLPYSTVGYSFGDSIVNGHSSFEGTGGINEAYIGFAGRPLRNLSIGVNAGFLFGNIINDAYTLSGTSASQSTLYETVMKVRSYNIQFGLQYSQPLPRDQRITLGLTYTLGHNLDGRTYGNAYDVVNGSNKPHSTDTLQLSHGYSLPHSFGAGISYMLGSKLSVEADFTYQLWSDTKFEGIPDTKAITGEGRDYFLSPETFTNRYRGAIGSEYLPRQRGSYFQRTAYRLGAYYEHGYQRFDTNTVREYGVTCGLGLPTPLRTRVSVGFEWRHRMTKPKATVSENYFLVNIGINLSENWFVPSKIY